MTGKGRTTVTLRELPAKYPWLGPNDRYWESDVYWVDLMHFAHGTRVTIGRHDNQPVEGPNGWYDLWSIKNQVLGEEAMAVELYPPLSLLVDGQHQRHLWLAGCAGSARDFSEKVMRIARAMHGDDDGREWR